MAAYNERQQFLRDVLCTALEGGCSHWAQSRNVIRDGLDYVSFELRDKEDPEDPWHPIHANTIEEMIERIRTKQVWVMDRDTILQASENNDAGMIDGDNADTLVQFAAYGDIVFG